MPFKPAVILQIWLDKQEFSDRTPILCQNYQIVCDQFWQSGKNTKIFKIHLLIVIQTRTECRFTAQEVKEDRGLTSLKSS